MPPVTGASEFESPDRAIRSPSLRSGQAYVLFAVSLALVVTVGTVAQLVSFRIGLVITELALILLPAILFVRFKRLPVAEALGWRRVSPGIALLGVAVGVTGWGVAAGIHEMLRPLLGDPPEVKAFAAQTLPELLLLLLCGAVLPGLCEESLFRGAIQGVLRRKGSRKAVLITAVLFALYHVSPWILVPGFFLGVVLGTLVVRTGSTVPAILAHMASNATAFTVGYLYRDQTEPAVSVPMAVLAVGFLAAFAVFWMMTRQVRPEPPILATVPAGVSRAVAWIVGIAGGFAALSVVAIVAAVFATVDVLIMTSDALAPQIERGDRVIVLESGVVELDLEAGDIVSYSQGGETLLREVSRIEGDTVWIRDGDAELELARDQITGKVVHTIRAGPVSTDGD